MIQDILPKRLYNEFMDVEPEADSYIISIKDSKILCNIDGGLSFPTHKEMGNAYKYRYLFRIDDMKYFLMEGNEAESDGYKYIDIAEIREKNIGPKYQDMALYTAKHLSDWYRDSRYCGRCGQVMTHSDRERAMVCPNCHNTIYPRIMPAVIVGVINGNKLLLTKYREGYSHYALVAGFTEIGETLEECVRREVREETGIEVTNIRYYKSQPWGVANDILMGFYCDVQGDPEIHMDGFELKYAQWVDRDEICLQPNDYSLTNEMMKRFKDGEES